MKITPGKLAKDYRRAYHLRDFVKAEINLGENLVYNIKIQEGNKEPEEEELAERIDGAVATIMALDRAIRCGNDNGVSVYDSRGLLFI